MLLPSLCALDADHLLAWSQRAQNLLAQSVFTNVGDEVTHYLKVDISLQQSDAHFAESFVQLLFSDAAPSA